MPGDTPVLAAADRRFRRSGARPVRRPRGGHRPWRAARAAVLAALVGAGAYRGAALADGARVFEVQHVVIRGNARLATGEVLGILDGLRGSSILRTRLGIWRRRLLTSPWVRDAALRRRLPSTVEVVISERTPMGLARIGSQLYLVDPGGSIIDEYGAQYREFDLPIIDGLAGPPRDGAPAVDEARADLAARVIDGIARDRELAGRVSQIDVRDVRNAIVLLDGDPAAVHLGDEQFLERLRSYAELAAALRERVPRIDYVDLRFGERVYVRPAGGGRPALAGARAAAAGRP
jgi:cell division protein FtsQ